MCWHTITASEMQWSPGHHMLLPWQNSNSGQSKCPLVTWKQTNHWTIKCSWQKQVSWMSFHPENGVHHQNLQGCVPLLSQELQNSQHASLVPLSFYISHRPWYLHHYVQQHHHCTVRKWRAHVKKWQSPHNHDVYEPENWALSTCFFLSVRSTTSPLSRIFWSLAACGAWFQAIHVSSLLDTFLSFSSPGTAGGTTRSS